jgi:hypothetical protein
LLTLSIFIAKLFGCRMTDRTYRCVGPSRGRGAGGELPNSRKKTTASTLTAPLHGCYFTLQSFSVTDASNFSISALML